MAARMKRIVTVSMMYNSSQMHFTMLKERGTAPIVVKIQAQYQTESKAIYCEQWRCAVQKEKWHYGKFLHEVYMMKVMACGRRCEVLTSENW